MQFLAFLLALVIWFGIIFWVKATIVFHYSRREENDHLELKLSALGGFWQFKLVVPTLKLDLEQGIGLLTQQEARAPTGEKRKAIQKLKVRYLRVGFFYALFPHLPYLLKEFNKIKRQFYRGIHCTEFDWEVEYGHTNPAVTALVSGSFWAMLGYSLGRMYNQVTMDVQEPRIMVKPDFQKPGFACVHKNSFNLRLGHVMIVGLRLSLFLLKNTLRWV